MEPSKEAIAVRIARLNRQILGNVTSGSNKLKKAIDREALLDALTVLYDECNNDPVKKCDELVRAFVDKYRSTLADLRRTRVCLSDFEILQTIGRGHFGEVHMVREKETSDVYALKTIRKETASRRAAGAAEDERDVLATATAPWMPRLQYAFQDASNLYLVMELCIGGDLAGLLARRNHPLAERDAAFYVAETAHALKALHGMGFVHRDVKPGNILLDRCGHVKLGDFGSCVRLSEGGAAVGVGTPDYVAPELLAAAECAARHSVCALSCRGIVQTAISACDYWSLGVVAFELVTLRRPFSSGDEDSLAKILSNIQRYEASEEADTLFEPEPNGPSAWWRALVRGLLRVRPERRYTYLDTLQHAALKHLPSHTIRDQAPPWVPCVRGPEDAAHFSPTPRAPAPPSAAPFRARPPFAGQLPYVGYSYVAHHDADDTASSGSGSGFSASHSHDCTAIDMATFKSAEKLAAMRAREIASLQSKLAAAQAEAEAAAGAVAEAERARRAADGEHERLRARLQADITALTLQNKRLERQTEVEKEERMALERTNQQLSAQLVDRSNAELRAAQATLAELQAERASLRAELARMASHSDELQAECARARADARAASQQQQHYKAIVEHAQEMRHRRLTEINVRAIDTIAKERALRRQTLSGGEAESREAGARVAQAEAGAAKEKRAREMAEKRVGSLEADNEMLNKELEELRKELQSTQEALGEGKRCADASADQLREAHTQLAHERARVAALHAQVQSLERGIEEAGRREAALEEQCARTEARLHERLEAADARAAAALSDDARHRDKVNTLEKLVRQLEREVSALESRACAVCEARETAGAGDGAVHQPAHSDTESVDDGPAPAPHAQVLREQLERAEAQLQTRADEIASLRQEARTANLARWRKEREYNELSVEAKSTARELKRLEEKLAAAVEARKQAEKQAAELRTELTTVMPQHERVSAELQRVKEQLDSLKKSHETAVAEVDRSRNDIRKLKCELQYSERRRLHAEEQEELSSRERAQLRDELTRTNAHNSDLVQNNKALQEACSLLEEQLTDLEKLSDLSEVKNKDLESEGERLRSELAACRARLTEAERAAAEGAAHAHHATQAHEDARDQAHHAHCQLQLLRERLDNRECHVSELEMRVASLEGAVSAGEAALGSALRRVRELQEECSALRTRAHHHHAAALQLRAALQEAQEEIAAVRETSDAANAWWRTRETKADATLRQQAKLIDFLQAKLEEVGRKKCSLSHKLFGRSGRRSNASPPLRRANRELREEIDKLRAKLSSQSLHSEPCNTPKRPKSVQSPGKTSVDLSDGGSPENSLLVIWGDGSRERMRASCESAAGAGSGADATGGGTQGAVLVLRDGRGRGHGGRGEREVRARLAPPPPQPRALQLPQNEANRAFTVSLETGGEACVVCATPAERAQWVSRLAPSTAPAPPPGYRPAALAHLTSRPLAALYLAPKAVAIGCDDGLHSLRSAINLETANDVSPSRYGTAPSITHMVLANGRALFIWGGVLMQASTLTLSSAVRRASTLKPSVEVTKVKLPDTTPPHYVKGISGHGGAGGEGSELAVVAAAACGRRVVLLRYEAGAGAFRTARALTVDRRVAALLLTRAALYIAGDKPLRLQLPGGALEAFAAGEPTVAAAAKKHSPPKAILLIKEDPVEILICYAECGVFVDEHGRRTRHEDPKWSCAVRQWEFVSPCLYLVGDDRVTVQCINDDAYRNPPCTCDNASTHSEASSTSECYVPEPFNLKLSEPLLLGTAPKGVLVGTVGTHSDTDTGTGYSVSLIEGLAALRSVGASVESISTVGSKRSSLDSAKTPPAPAPAPPLPSPPEPVAAHAPAPAYEPRSRPSLPESILNTSHDSVEASTGFLADIRKRAKQMRKKNRVEKTPEDVIKEILTTEVGLKRYSAGRKSPALISECDTDSDNDDRDLSNDTDTSKTKETDEICGEMFTRQVRFHPITE